MLESSESNPEHFGLLLEWNNVPNASLLLCVISTSNNFFVTKAKIVELKMALGCI